MPSSVTRGEHGEKGHKVPDLIKVRARPSPREMHRLMGDVLDVVGRGVQQSVREVGQRTGHGC